MTLLLPSLLTAAWMFAMLCLGFVLGVVLVCLCHAAQRGDEERDRATQERTVRERE